MLRIGDCTFHFGLYDQGYHPHFAWGHDFKCVPAIIGNFYIFTAYKS